MNLRDAVANIGKGALVQGADGLRASVVIVDVRHAYGVLRYVVEQGDGSHAFPSIRVTVDAARVTVVS